VYHTPTGEWSGTPFALSRFIRMDEKATRRGGDATVLITIGIVLGAALLAHVVAVAVSA
jgi:hypothetical protein